MPRSRVSPRYIPACLIILALLARTLVPAGFMPGGTKDGYISIEICTAGGLASVLVPKDRAPAPKQGHDSDAPCPFMPAFAKALGGLPAMYGVLHGGYNAQPSFPRLEYGTLIRVFTAYSPHAPPAPSQKIPTLIL